MEQILNIRSVPCPPRYGASSDRWELSAQTTSPACRFLRQPIRLFVPRDSTVRGNPVESHSPLHLLESLDNFPYHILPRGLPRFSEGGQCCLTVDKDFDLPVSSLLGDVYIWESEPSQRISKFKQVLAEEHSTLHCTPYFATLKEYISILYNILSSSLLVP